MECAAGGRGRGRYESGILKLLERYIDMPGVDGCGLYAADKSWSLNNV